MGAAKATIDHDLIRRWVEERGGWPARVRNTGGHGDVGMIRIDFPGYSGESSLEKITWEEFFAKFEDKHLALLYQDEEVKPGEPSRFNKLVSRDSIRESGE